MIPKMSLCSCGHTMVAYGPNPAICFHCDRPLNHKPRGCPRCAQLAKI